MFQGGVAVDVRGERQAPGEKSWLERGLDVVGGAISAPGLPDVPDLDPVQVWIHLGLDSAEAQDLYPTIYTGMRAMFRMPGDPRL